MIDQEIQADWHALADEVWLGVAEWRAANPKATFAEIEQAVEERLATIRTRVLADVALASAVRDIATQDESERPRCPDCHGELEARGQQARELTTLRGDTVRLRRSYSVCRVCGHGLFPPR